MVSDECFDCSEAVGMAALCVADYFKASPSTGLSRVQTAAHRHCTRHSSSSMQGPVRECCWHAGLDSLSEGIFQADGNRVGSELQ